MEKFNPQGLHAEDIGVDPHVMTPSGLGDEDDPSKLVGTVVAPPAYTDPGNPAAASGSVNLPLDDHPLEISEDYGEQAFADGHVAAARSTLTLDADNSSGAGKPREEWVNADYKEALAAAGLPTSGNRKELEERLAEYEADNGSGEDDDDDDNDEQ